MPNAVPKDENRYQSPAGAEYWTPEMAAAIARLAVRTVGAATPAVIVMGGHRDGLISYAADLDGAGAILLDLHGRPG